MKEKILKIRKYILMVLGLLILSTLYVGMKYLMRPKYEPLPVVKLKDKETNKKKFAVMVQNGDSYEEYTNEDGTWPSEEEGYEFKEAKCIDNDGQLVNNAVTFESGKVTLKTNKTIYCTLYFDEKPKEPLEITNVAVNNISSSSVTLIVSVKGGTGKYTYSVEISCHDECGQVKTSCGGHIENDNNVITIDALSYCNNAHTFNIKVTDSNGDTDDYEVSGVNLLKGGNNCNVCTY